MKNLINILTTMRLNIISPRSIMLLFTPLLLVNWVHAQSPNDSPASKELYDQIASLDAAFFDAYNTCDLVKVETFFAEDVEFFHEKGGLITTRRSVMEVMKKNLCGDGSNRVRRELVKGSLEVHSINNYGAVEIGEHRFYLTQKGQKEKLDGIGKFVNLWQKKDGQWRMSRVLSYGFRPGE
ncbi:MAG TPA: nuclear transport factor 2 family protein [Pyrinomonadaceae bacterium]|nr:nuclear transport factor 2 family protein [Pyrinomonadaceae bacterium]